MGRALWRWWGGAPLLSALLLGLAFPPLDVPLLPFVALVPLALWTMELPMATLGRNRALAGGLVFGAVHFALLFHWVPLAIVGDRSDAATFLFAAVAFTLIVAGLATMAGGFVWLLHQSVSRVGAPLWLALPVTWTAFEWARAHLPTTLALPWLGLGTSLAGTPELMGIAELVGGRGVSFWIAAVNGLLATSVLATRRGRGRAWVPALATVAVAVLPMAWGVWRADTLETRAAATVAVVQPNRTGRVKVPATVGPMGATPVEAPTFSDATVARIRAAPPELVVLPELFLRADPRWPTAAPAVEALQSFSRRVDAPVLFGGLAVEETGAGGRVRYNAVHLLDSEGLTGFRYDKRHLVPVVERTPVLFPAWGGADTTAGDYGVGAGWPVARVGDVAYGALVCYESSYPEAARALRRAGADVLVNVTNDAWLGGAGPVRRTVALWQHPAHLVLRAVENRMGVVRAANTGISLFVDPVGHVHEATDLFVDAVRSHTVRTTDVETAFTRFGDLLGNASAAAAAGLLLLALAAGGGAGEPRRRMGSSLDPSGVDV